MELYNLQYTEALVTCHFEFDKDVCVMKQTLLFETHTNIEHSINFH